ncbi:hypothetical protein [Streptomyces chartreusis]
MTRHNEDTPTNGADPDGPPTLRRVLPALGPSPAFKPVRLGDPTDDLDHHLLHSVELPGGEQEHEELVSRLIREGEALRTELGLPGFATADAPPSTHLTGTPDQPTADHADNTVPEAPAVHAKAAGAHQHREPRRRTPHRLRGRKRRVPAPDWATVVTHAHAETGHTTRLLATRLLPRILGVVVRDTVSEAVWRKVTRHTDRILWLCAMFSPLVIAGDVSLGMPSWLSRGSGLLLLAVFFWRVLRQNHHEPDLDQQAVPRKDDQRT